MRMMRILNVMRRMIIDQCQNTCEEFSILMILRAMPIFLNATMTMRIIARKMNLIINVMRTSRSKSIVKKKVLMRVWTFKLR